MKVQVSSGENRLPGKHEQKVGKHERKAGKQELGLSKQLAKKYKELRKEYPGEEYKYLFEGLPGISDIDAEIERDEEIARKKSIDELKDDYWNIASFIFHKVQETGICRKWSKAQFDSQFGVCAICHKPMSNLRNARIEHVVSRREFGANYAENLVLVHKNCKRKGNLKLEVDKLKYRENRFDERLDEMVAEVTAEVRQDYPVKFPDEVFEKK